MNVRADPSRTLEFMSHKPVALVVAAELCTVHRGEFEKLGWLVPPEEEESE